MLAWLALPHCRQDLLPGSAVEATGAGSGGANATPGESVTYGRGKKLTGGAAGRGLRAAEAPASGEPCATIRVAGAGGGGGVRPWGCGAESPIGGVGGATLGASL